MTPRLELCGVRKAYGNFVAVDDVSLAVPEATVFGLLGPNGAGKTTTIRMIMDIIAPDRGEVRFFGRPRQRKDLERVGYLPEERGLYRKMTVREHLVFLAELHGMRRRDTLPGIERWLERLDLVAWGDKKVEELSKGMQQKVQLIGTLLHDPDIVILDEPFSGLDPINQGLFKEAVAELKRAGKAIIFSTHIMEHAEKLCDRICLVSRGVVVLAGEMAEVKRRFGGNTFRLAASGELDRVATVEGVAAVAGENGNLKLVLADDAQGSDVLRRLVGFLDVREFASEDPDLETIFIKAVRDAA